MSESATLVKFGTRDHLLPFLEKGKLYMNTPSYFRSVEDKELRGDRYDSMYKIEQGARGIVVFKTHPDVPIEINHWVLGEDDPASSTINLFCMFALRPKVGSYPVDSKNFRFGDSALVLVDPQKFINRVHDSLQDMAILHHFDLMEYVPESYTGLLGSFKKFSTFAYQSEWRIVCFDGPGRPRCVEIGSIEDIAAIIPSSEINKYIRVV